MFSGDLGHGGRLRDENNEEHDGYDETLIPVNYQSAGQIRDDTIFAELVGSMVEGSTMVSGVVVGGAINEAASDKDTTATFDGSN